jgi:hypothetical protein
MTEREIELELARWDYEQTVATVRQLTDIRFKLLAFVPTLSGIAIGLVTRRVQPGVEAAVGAFGFLITLGIAFYDQRNSALYDELIGRARWLEATILRLPSRHTHLARGGQYAERPGERRRLFGLIEIWHDRALALIYGTVLGGWTFLFLLGAFDWSNRAAGIGAAFVAFLLTLELQRLGHEGPLARRWWSVGRHHWRERRRAEWEAERRTCSQRRKRIEREVARFKAQHRDHSDSPE